MDQETKGSLKAPTNDELIVAYEGPAPGANRFFVTLGQPGVRIAFVEQEATSGKCFFRAAATLHPFDAIQLQRLLKTMLAGLEPQMDAALAAENEADDGGE